MALIDPLPHVVFFDLDSTLITYTEGSEVSWQIACCRYEAQLAPLPVEQVVKAILDQAGWFWSDPARHKTGRLDLRQARRGIAMEAFNTLGFQDQGLAEKVADAMSDHRDMAITMIPGSLETLASLSASGVRLGLITNGDSKGQRWKIHQFGLERFFEHIQIEGEAGLGKPEDGVYELALQKFGVEASQAWMVGDDLVWDIQAAQKARVWAVWVDYERKGLPENAPCRPDRVIHSLSELVR